MRLVTCILLALAPIMVPAVYPASRVEKLNATQLVELAKSGGAALSDAITATFDPKDLKEGTAWAGRGPDFFFATEAPAKPDLFIDGSAGPAMQNLPSSDIWYAPARIEQLGKLHSFYYIVNGVKFGGKLDIPAFRPLSYLQPACPPERFHKRSSTPAKSTTA